MNRYLNRILEAFRNPQSLGANVIFILLQTVFETGSITLLMLVVTKKFGPELVGCLGVVMAGVQLVVMMGDGLFISLIRSIATKFEISHVEGKRIVGGLALIAIGTGAIISLLVGTIGLFVSSELGINSTLWIFLGICVAITRVGKSCCEAALRAVRDFRTPMIAGSVFTVVAVIIGIVLVSNGFKVSAYLTLMSLSQFFNILYLLYRISRFSPVFFSGVDKMLIWDFFDYSKILAFRGFVSFFYFQVNVILIALLSSPTEAGYYRFFSMFLTFSPLILSSILNGFAPRIVGTVEKGGHEISVLLGKMYGYCLLSTIPFVIIFAAAPFLIEIFFSDFVIISPAFLIFIPVTIVQVFGYAGTLTMSHGGYSKVSFYLSLFPALFNVLAILIAFAFGDFHDSIWVMAIIYCLTNVISCYLTHHYFKAKFRITL